MEIALAYASLDEQRSHCAATEWQRHFRAQCQRVLAAEVTVAIPIGRKIVL